MIELTLNETRVLGVLFEKEHTTPDQYPLSLNALTNGCNQKSNREPVLDLSETLVQETVDGLMAKGLVTEVAVGSRVRKYRQRFGNTEFGDFKFSLAEQSILCVLFLRGAQTPGEIRIRTARLCEFHDVQEVESALQGLMVKNGDPFVTRLAREPGKRESRFAHLFSGEIIVSQDQEVDLPSAGLKSGACDECQRRISQLEQTVQDLQNDIDELKRQWQALNE